MSWTPTSLAASFDSYELQRSEDGSVTWATVATSDTEALADFDDYETPRGIAVLYRVRVIRTDAVTSDWSTTASGSARANKCEIIFTSNISPDLTVAYNRSPELAYSFPSAAERQLVPIFGRDYQVAFVPTEDRGVTFGVPLTVNVRTVPPAGAKGVDAFTPLRTLSQAPDIPYVRVLDYQGNSYYADLNVPDGPTRQPHNIYIANVVVTEVTGTPYPVPITT